jgi:hypothetical protein
MAKVADTRCRHGRKAKAETCLSLSVSPPLVMSWLDLIGNRHYWK